MSTPSGELFLRSAGLFGIVLVGLRALRGCTRIRAGVRARIRVRVAAGTHPRDLHVIDDLTAAGERLCNPLCFVTILLRRRRAAQRDRVSRNID